MFTVLPNVFFSCPKFTICLQRHPQKNYKHTTLFLSYLLVIQVDAHPYPSIVLSSVRYPPLPTLLDQKLNPQGTTIFKFTHVEFTTPYFLLRKIKRVTWLNSTSHLKINDTIKARKGMCKGQLILQVSIRIDKGIWGIYWYITIEHTRCFNRVYTCMTSFVNNAIVGVVQRSTITGMRTGDTGEVTKIILFTLVTRANRRSWLVYSDKYVHMVIAFKIKEHCCRNLASLLHPDQHAQTRGLTDRTALVAYLSKMAWWHSIIIIPQPEGSEDIAISLDSP